MKNPAKNIPSEKMINAVEIPADGSLGLLALGAVGIKAWRKKRAAESLKEDKNKKNG